MMNIFNEENAARYVLKELGLLGYKWDAKDIKYINKGRYCVVKGNPIIAILLKDRPFMNFGHQFRKAGETGVGDTINCKEFKEFISEGVERVYTVFRDGKIYYANLIELLHNSHKWTQKEGTEVRSFSIHRYKRIEQ